MSERQEAAVVRGDLAGRRLVKSTLVAVLAAGLLSVQFVSGALAATWNASCASGRACVWGNAGFSVPLAATAASEIDYGTHNYPNTQSGMNDSVSSVRNTFGVKDVVFYGDAGYSGSSFCLNAGYQMSTIGSFNDEISSHVVAVGTTC